MIDPRAIVDPGAEIAADVEIGPFAVIGAGVRIGSGSWVGPHAVVKGPTVLGRGTRVFQFASIGDAPQDKKYAGEPTRLVAGERNVFREFCSINRGTVGGRGETTIGDDCLFMAYSHVAHDCIVGSHCVMSNCTALAGHVELGDRRPEVAVIGLVEIAHVVGVTHLLEAVDHRALEAELAHASRELGRGDFGVVHRQGGEGRIAAGMARYGRGH